MKIRRREIEHEIVKFDSNFYSLNDVQSTPILPFEFRQCELTVREL